MSDSFAEAVAKESKNILSNVDACIDKDYKTFCLCLANKMAAVDNNFQIQNTGALIFSEKIWL